MNPLDDQIRFLQRDLDLQLSWLREWMARGSLLPADLAAGRVVINDVESLRARIARLRQGRAMGMGSQEGVRS